MTLFLDSNATTPLDPRVRAAIFECFDEPGNAGSTHRFGQRAKQRVHQARDRIAACVGARRHEVLFTSGATESNNLAILGLAPHGEDCGKRHIVSTRIEHRAVLEPLRILGERGFEISLISPDCDGRVSADDILSAVRSDTLLVSVMQVNNETGICQPIYEIAEGLQQRADRPWFHVDAAQGFGKCNEMLSHPVIDFLSLSGHKIHGPQGIGAIVLRRRDGCLPPLVPLLHGGGQELGLRSGTLPVPLIVGFGVAAELAAREAAERAEHCGQLRDDFLKIISPLDGTVHGDSRWSVPHTVNISFPGWDAEELIEALDEIAAISDGAACTSVCATASHVLVAMGVRSPAIDGAVRFSWSHITNRKSFRDAVHSMVLRLQSPIPSG